MSNLGVYVDFRGELVRESPDWMERDFCRRKLTMIFLYLQQYLPKDVVKMIGKMVERDYKVDPVWEFLLDRQKNKPPAPIVYASTITFMVQDITKYDIAYQFLPKSDSIFYYYDIFFFFTNEENNWAWPVVNFK